ncbi:MULTISPECIES: DNA adenine methylase [unclassified Mesorhizobium]|uniref:DNA adenine methylase n=1 Tax=unclassified Mesorhizobium TaxID=325217 RepID=UPI000FCCA263|nr:MULTISPECIES: DNA adenine methylase [unclassified Mesorhizobium]RUU55420.1 DNA adenine methylase [Mesorhizobium sp. M7A.T.Ca.TU.009.01.1.1]RUU75444.1 DNA adenine methylase [Mesorhizobium sp. M7A.T.Ca.TU.009.01.1.2]TJV23790.1 MAG: DNA adenine methylase [Mesorhizobium sp.]RUT81015.1 DNA adenine methylase [Mesorhizobium sp. M7A.T.Ca.US.000.02.1.1]RUT93252.1 DNA adenine methylase [Mesorhizobium sp. M7A.T.Ca.US.000.02.2.1]
MSVTASPLRYPGGKTCLLPLISQVLRINDLELGHYAEPYAGGCGLALSLLYGGHVSDIHINDVDPSIWSFWHSVLMRTEELCYLVAKTPITIDEWRRQRQIHLTQDQQDPLSLGFSAFFLNRTNRSGIIKDAGVIGGLAQIGTYKIDCRFNRDDLIRRIRRVSKYKNRIHLSRRDALAFINDMNAQKLENTFFCIDPPYFSKGSSLYTSFYNPSDHAILASVVLKLEDPWVVTYDNAPQVSKLYRDRRQYEFDINYSVETKRIGTELFIASKGLKLPGSLKDRQVNRPQYRPATSSALSLGS